MPEVWFRWSFRVTGSSGVVPGLEDRVIDYDDHRRPSQVQVGSRSWSFDYSPFGLLQSVTDPLGRTTEVDRDASGRPMREEYADATQVSFDWDANGFAISVEPDDGAHYTMDNDHRGQATRWTAASASGQPAIGYTYDLDDRLETVEFSDGRIVDFDWDDHDRISAVDSPSAGVAYDYDDTTGHLLGVDRLEGGHLVQSLAYDWHHPKLRLRLRRRWRIKNCVTARSDDVTFSGNQCVIAKGYTRSPRFEMSIVKLEVARGRINPAPIARAKLPLPVTNDSCCRETPFSELVFETVQISGGRILTKDMLLVDTLFVNSAGSYTDDHGYHRHDNEVEPPCFQSLECAAYSHDGEIHCVELTRLKLTRFRGQSEVVMQRCRFGSFVRS